MAQSYIDFDKVLNAHHDQLTIFDQRIMRTYNDPGIVPVHNFTYKDGLRWLKLSSDEINSTLMALKHTLEEDHAAGLLNTICFVSVSALEATHLWAAGLITFDHLRGARRMHSGELMFENFTLEMIKGHPITVTLLVSKRGRGVVTLTGSMTIVGIHLTKA